MQYPDNIVITGNADFIQNEQTGNFEPVSPGTAFSSECRAEPAGSNPVIKGKDGDDIVFSWIVYLPKTSEVFQFGDKVAITKADGSVFNADVKRQYNGQFNSRLWV